MVGDPDEEILQRFVRGDEAAFEALFRRFEGEVYGWVVRIVRDHDAAEAVVVESFWRAYRARARFDLSRSFGAWMRRIATNAALDFLRARRRRPEGGAPESESEARPGLDPGVRRAISLAFERLSPKLRVVAALALVEGRPHAEIAEALGVPVGTVKSRISRACARLRSELVRLGVRP